MIIQWTKDDLEAIRQIVKEELERLTDNKQEKLFTRDELCEHLGIDPSTYHRHVKAGRIRVMKIGNKLKLLQAA